VPGAWKFLALAYGFGLLCGGAGVALLAFGSGGRVGEEALESGEVAKVGIGLIVLGVAAAALTWAIQRTRD
jgi:hypothetical protein